LRASVGGHHTIHYSRVSRTTSSGVHGRTHAHHSAYQGVDLDDRLRAATLQCARSSPLATICMHPHCQPTPRPAYIIRRTQHRDHVQMQPKHPSGQCSGQMTPNEEWATTHDTHKQRATTLGPSGTRALIRADRLTRYLHIGVCHETQQGAAVRDARPPLTCSRCISSRRGGGMRELKTVGVCKTHPHEK
jgi:hypothetical protein